MTHGPDKGEPEIRTRSRALQLIHFQWAKYHNPKPLVQPVVGGCRSHANGFLMEGAESGSHRRSYDPQILSLANSRNYAFGTNAFSLITSAVQDLLCVPFSLKGNLNAKGHARFACR